MKESASLVLTLLTACSISSVLAGDDKPLTVSTAPYASGTIDYSGRLTVAGEPFTGTGNFRFALLGGNGATLWTNNDNEAPIEKDIPSGLVKIPVKNGVYRVRLGDSGLGMKALPATNGALQRASHVRIWFDDGVHGWAPLGDFGLRSGEDGGSAAKAPVVKTSDANILAELRKIKGEIAALRRQVSSGAKGALPSRATAKETRPKPEAKPITVILKEAERHSLGKPDAPLVLVEFTDYECGYCKRFFEQTFARIKEQFIDTGKLRFVSRNMPMQSHPQSGPAALALLSAAEQKEEEYWKMRGWLFQNIRDLSPTTLTGYATEAGLDRAKFEAGIASKKHDAEVREDVRAARAIGITGTPSFVLGTSDGQMIRGERIIGSKPFSVFKRKIEAFLAKGNPTTAVRPYPAPGKE